MGPLHFLTPVQTTMVPSLCLPHNTGSPRAFCRDTGVGVLGRRGPAAVSCQVRWCSVVPTQALVLVLPGPRQGLLEVEPAGEAPSMAPPGGVFLWPALA